jgi:hypothetical protein
MKNLLKGNKMDWNLFMPDNIKSSYILLPNSKRAHILKYVNMNIDYIERISVVNGRSITNKYPAINYEVIMLDYDKEILYELFEVEGGSSLRSAYKHKYANIVLEGEDNDSKQIKCRVDTYIPVDSIGNISGRHISEEMKKIKIEILLDNSNEKLNFTRRELTEDMRKQIENAHIRRNEYTRYDIMDLEEDE